MAKVSVYDINGKEVDTLELNDAIFGVNVNEHLVHLAVVAQLANKRQGNTKGKDPFRSKRWRKKALEAEGNRSCSPGINKITTVEGWRSCIRTNT